LASGETAVAALQLEYREDLEREIASLYGVDLDGQQVWGPVELDATDGDIARLADERLAFAGWDDGGPLIQLLSADGEQLESHAFGDGDFHPTTVAATPEGDVVLGGYVGEYDREGIALLMQLAPDGTPRWDLELTNNFVHDVDVDPAGTVLALAVDAFIEGNDVFLCSVTPAGEMSWSIIVGSEGGFGNELLTPFAVAQEGTQGALTLGVRHSPATPDTPATDHVVVTRYRADSTTQWSSEELAPDSVEPPQRGELAVVVELGVVSVASAGTGSPTTMLLHSMDGDLLCAESIADPDGVPRGLRLVPLPDGHVVTAGSVRTDAGGHGWIARFAVTPG